jgi:hypothetical protein
VGNENLIGPLSLLGDLFLSVGLCLSL